MTFHVVPTPDYQGRVPHEHLSDFLDAVTIVDDYAKRKL